MNNVVDPKLIIGTKYNEFTQSSFTKTDYYFSKKHLYINNKRNIFPINWDNIFIGSSVLELGINTAFSESTPEYTRLDETDLRLEFGIKQG